jgi:hypothetical protein
MGAPQIADVIGGVVCLSVGILLLAFPRKAAAKDSEQALRANPEGATSTPMNWVIIGVILSVMGVLLLLAGIID